MFERSKHQAHLESGAMDLLILPRRSLTMIHGTHKKEPAIAGSIGL